MTTTTLSRITLHRPAWRRAADAIVQAWQVWLAGRARRRALRQAAVRRCLASLGCWDPRHVSALDEHLMRDIGVPDWLREEALALRQGDASAAVWEAGARW